MKKNLFYFTMFLFAASFLISCNKDDDDPIIIDNPVYGMQISGTATGGEVFAIDADQMIEPGSDFATKEKRDGMYYGIYYLTAGDIAFQNVLPTTTTTYGITGLADSTQTAETGEPFTYKRGTLVEGGSDVLTISEAGLYYIITDETSMGLWIMKINNFEISATGDLAEFVEGSATGATFKATGVDIRGAFKVRINTSWKIIAADVAYTGTAVSVDDHVRMVTSYGGSIDVMTPDGDDMTVDNGGKLLDFTFTWTPGSKGIAGIVGTTEEGEELPPLEYPEKMYMIGASVGGWTWGTDDIEMIPVNGNAHLFWRIVWLETGITDPGFKFCEEQDWGKDFGVEGDAVDGVYAKGTANVPEVATSGYYNVVVNLKDETIEVNPAKVYAIGAAFGGAWTASDPTLLFTEDAVNKLLVSPAATATDKLRMHTSSTTMTIEDGSAPVEWWQAEFNIIDGNIEYRGTGGDQAGVDITTGQVAKLDFVNGTGVIE